MTIDELADYGISRMDDEEIRAFLSSHGVGVLGLPTEGAPSLRPMSFGYDGEDALYLLYIVGSDSRKATLSDRAEVASFLAYSAEATFNWRSVLLTGHIERVDDAAAVTERVTLPWQPEVLRRAGEAEGTELYRFDITDWSGLKHLGLPSGFESGEESDDTA